MSVPYSVSASVNGCAVAALLVVVSLACTASQAGAMCSGSDAEVLILGAGVAGISAAKTLSDGGITNFLILEAQDRIGGRVKNTVLPSGIRLELGANWIQGIDPAQPEKHPLWKIAEKCGGLKGNFVLALNNATHHVFDEHGSNITNSAVVKNRFSRWNRMYDPGLITYSKKRKASGLPDMSMRQALENNGWFPSSLLDDMVEWNGFDDEYATIPEHISLYENFPDRTYTDFGSNTGDYFVTDQEEGFVKVVQCLANDFLAENDHRLHLRSTVVEVDWSSGDCVCVTTRENGTLQEYCASDAILTFSLGVLKSNAVKFVPDLPATKRSAIDSLRYDLYLKIFLEFKEIFWNKEINVDTILHVSSVRGLFVQFEPLMITNTTPILFTTVTGEVAKNIYSQSLENTTNQIMKVLRVIYGEGIPDPVSVTIPDWWVNPLFRGTYSNVPPGIVKGALKEALKRLHFSGEATSIDYSGYVHGGYFSGIDAAKEIMNNN